MHLYVCCSAEQYPPSKGAASPPFCRIWSPHSLRELALVQLPSHQDVISAQFSCDGNVLLMLLADPQHSLAVYCQIHAVLRGRLLGDSKAHKSSALPVLHATHVLPCTRSMLNGLTVETFPQRPGQHASRLVRAGYRWASARPDSASQGGRGAGCDNGLRSSVRFATFGVGHLRLWSVNSERFSQPPSYRSLCIARSATDGSNSEGSEVTACAFLTSGDVIAALADRRLVLFRGLSPVRSVSLPACASRILMLQPLQRSLLLLVAQEGLVQLLPLSSLISLQTPQRALSGRLPDCTKQSQQEELDCSECTSLPYKASRFTGGTPYSRAGRLPKSQSLSTIPRKTVVHSHSASRLKRSAPPFATDALDAPARTPRSTYDDSVGNWSTNRSKPQSSHCPSGSNRFRARRQLSKASLVRSLSAGSRVSTRSSGRTIAAQPDRQQRSARQRPAKTPPKVGKANSFRELHPKRSLTTQEVATRRMRKADAEGAGTLWLPLHSSQVTALHWSDPVLLLCTRTQIMAVDASHLSGNAAVVLQERPLGNLDVTAFLPLPCPQANVKCIHTASNHCDKKVDLPYEAAEGSSGVIVAGGRCCVGGELRLWELCSREQSSTAS